MIWARKGGHPVQTPWEIEGQTARAVATLDGKSRWSIQKAPHWYFIHLTTEGRIVETFCVDVPTLSAAMLWADDRILPGFPAASPPPPSSSRGVGLMWGGLYVDSV